MIERLDIVAVYGEAAARRLLPETRDALELWGPLFERTGDIRRDAAWALRLEANSRERTRAVRQAITGVAAWK